ncbi:hypothetical protein FE783_15430 [Paenibacillus mesophilus]|uniref:anti-sigma factor n=1 Tax=Paenibacillus mesophilus TaxID=2582849 RepID=UPI00110DF54C|nr:anti-sigma factor [Paenibacillus mesophilus]TMV49059.1 hypothetical protein FE783_15430 [Paenibacillus mesophilus]
MSRVDNPCEQVFSFFLGEMTEEETLAFHAHLSECPACQEELKELRQVWDALPYTMTELELPEQMKSEVLTPILQKQAKPASKRPARPGNRHVWRYAAAALLVLVIGFTGLFGLSQWRKDALTHSEDLHLPAEVLQKYSLKPFDPAMPAASGQVWLTEKGGRMELVLQTSGLSALQGEQAYQVWLVKDGNRLNCGTFRVDSQGNGVLTYKIDEHERQFDTIGITLEPDSGGNKPRGKKVLGT